MARLKTGPFEGEETSYVPFGGRYALPSPFRAQVTPMDSRLPVCHMVIALEGGQPVCVDLRLERRRGGPPLSGALIREIPLARFIRNVTARQVVRLTTTADGRVVGEPVSREEVEEAEYLEKFEAFEEHKPPRRGQPVSDDELRRTARIYRKAIASGQSPTRAVAEELFVSRATAGRRVAKARERGFLGKALPRTAGEID